MLLIEAWLGLASTLQTGDWSESEVARALDLLGVSLACRSGRTIVDNPEGGDAADFRRFLTFEEIERLEALRDKSLAPLEDMEQRQAIAGDIALLSKPARLMLRYERDAWKRYRESMRRVRERAEVEMLGVEFPVPRVEIPPVRKVEPRAQAVAASGSDSERSSEEERQALRAMAAPILEMFAGRLEGLDLGDAPDWLVEMERRLDGGGRSIENPGDCSVTERTHFSSGRSDPFSVVNVSLLDRLP